MGSSSQGNKGGMKSETEICAGTTVGDGEESNTTLASVGQISVGGRSRHFKRTGKRAGRPLLLVNDPDIIKRAYYACAELGATVQQLSKILPASKHALHSWMRNDKAFHSAVRLGMDVFNSNKVEKALLQRALGFEYKEVTEQDVEVFGQNKLGMSVKVPAHKTTTTHKLIPPDVGALIFYLTNRDGGRWRQTFRTETSNTNETFHQHNVTVDWSKVPKEDLEALRNIIRRIEPANGGNPDPQAIGRRARQDILA